MRGWHRESKRHSLASYGIPTKFGPKDDSQLGKKTGGIGQNRTDVCRNPETKLTEPDISVLSGGLAEGQKPERYDEKQLEKGTEIEMEHTNNPYVARRVAMDHLESHSDYYKYLAKMENRLEKREIRKEQKLKRKQDALKRKKRRK